MRATTRAAAIRRVALRTAGTVAALAGGHQVATGMRGVSGIGSAAATDSNADSEIRFYATWYAISGVLMLAAAASPATDRALQPAFEAGWSLAVVGRLLSARAVGRPGGLFIALTALEVGVAGALIATRRSTSPSSLG